MDCLFCNIESERVIASNEVAFAIKDGFPVTASHTLVIPKRHAETYFDLTADELLACDELLRSFAAEIKLRDPTVEGFNIGINAGAAAGQTIFHCHIHLIPRRNGDVENPRGGIRHLIPGKGYY